MRTRLLLPLTLSLILAACGGTAASPAAVPSSGGAATEAPAPATGPAGAVDCTKIKAAGVQLISVQLLAQLSTPDAVASIKSKQLGILDVDAFLAAMHDLHALDAYSSPLGDPKAAIDAYETAAKAAQVLFATDPVTQGAIDSYMTNVGTLTAFLGHQAAIAGAMDAAGC